MLGAAGHEVIAIKRQKGMNITDQNVNAWGELCVR